MIVCTKIRPKGQKAVQTGKTSFRQFSPLNLRFMSILPEIDLKGVLGTILLIKHYIIEFIDVLYISKAV